MQTFDIVFLKTIKTLFMHLYHSTDGITSRSQVMSLIRRAWRRE